MRTDKEIEKERYNSYAIESPTCVNFDRTLGSDKVSVSLCSPYLCYEDSLKKILNSSSKVLEIGSGMGLHTGVILNCVDSGSVIATDISSEALRVLEKRFSNYKTLTTSIEDMESLSFSDNSFDVVTCAGAMSYGDGKVVLKEILRVLKPGGFFVCVDSFNHNPIYRINRWLHYLRGRRTISTLKRMPNDALILLYKNSFDKVVVKYFGSFSWLAPLMVIFFGEHKAKKFLDATDRILSVHRSAFKFVMVARKRSGPNGNVG